MLILLLKFEDYFNKILILREFFFNFFLIFNFLKLATSIKKILLILFLNKFRSWKVFLLI